MPRFNYFRKRFERHLFAPFFHRRNVSNMSFETLRRGQPEHDIRTHNWSIFRTVRSQLYPSSEVVLADLGGAALARPYDRYQRKLRPCAQIVAYCTAQYRAPDMLLGSQRYGTDLDSWSLGCVAAELYLRAPLFKQTGKKLLERSILDAHFALLGAPPTDTFTQRWMKLLPFVETFYGAQSFPANVPPEWPPKRLRACPPQLADFVRQNLKWHPKERLAATSARLHSFVSSRPLSVIVKVQEGKNGLGTIVEGVLDDELLDYLQKCPTWEQLAAECRQTNYEANACMHQDEGKLRMKREFVGYIDANNPPECKSLNSDANIPLIKSERLQFFVKALRRCAKAWLDQLTARVRAEIRRLGLPSEYLVSNGAVFMEENFADNAFVYASVQVLKIGAREDAWHTDGGTSLLHAAVTVFGSRTLQVDLGDAGCISLPQRPGSFYVGNLCALSHNVVHGENAAGSYGEGPPSEQVQIAVMLRTDVFRAARARKINSTPGPAELFRIVNTETAKHLAEQPFYLPDLAAVIAESREAGNESTG